MPASIPAISGKQLIKLLQRDGWVVGRKAKHGRCLTKKVMSGRTKVTFVPDTRASLPEGTLSQILGSKQTGIGRHGLRTLIDRYGLR